MSDAFSADWLALREPRDHASVNADLRKRVADLCATRRQMTIVDLGAGAGSNLRGLSPWLPFAQHWRLVDHDIGLLQRASRSTGDGPVQVTIHQADLHSADLDALLDGSDLVTAAAFFDLASDHLVERIARACARHRLSFYTVLTYDGIAAWLPEHPADSDMRRLFNSHQRSDKGLGPALGPDATKALDAAFQAQGYTTSIGPSPWVVGPDETALRTQLEQGWADAVAATGGLPHQTIEDWRAHRAQAGRVTIVGHEDFLAVPAECV